MSETPNALGAPPPPPSQHAQPSQQPSSSSYTPAVPHTPPQPQPQPPQAQAQPEPAAQNIPAPKQPQTPYPAAAPPGAPGRNYLNTHLAPYLRTGMSSVLDAKPQFPLRYLGEYLIAQSLLHEGGTDEQGVVKRFIYTEHAVAVKRANPGATTALVQGAEADGVEGVTNGAGHGTGEDETGDKRREEDADERVKDRKVEGDTEMGGI